VPISLNNENIEALTLGERCFDYRRLVELLFSGNWSVPFAAQLNDDEDAERMLILAEALSRTQNKTHGLQSRLVLLPRKVVAGGWFTGRTEALAGAAAAQMNEIASAYAALREAVLFFAIDGNSQKLDDLKKNNRKKRVLLDRYGKSASERLDVAADDAFFDHLWDRADPETEAAAQARFRALLVKAARVELERAFQTIPCATLFSARAKVRARRRLENALRKAELLEKEAEHA
jgi:hypothetical protein